MAEGQDMLGPVVSREGRADRLHRLLAPDISVLREDLGIVDAHDDGANDPHARDTRDVGHHVV
jgi:hypothetical protein